ncbi:MAG: AsnC family transcriptional regulator [Euryarchaeota archaeon]|nr:AsnC family transcriptional regulator [Euryarchaeota archaeon]MBO96782.1 AsnC family transcriptional regulator [Euryarchaeota archaeon]
MPCYPFVPLSWSLWDRRGHKQEVFGRVGVVVSTAFVLIKTAPQKELDVYLTLLDLEAVSETHVSYGEYDLVARIDFEDEQQMARTLIGQMRSIEGVVRTETLIAVEV